MANSRLAFGKIANFVVNSHLHFAKNVVVAENIRLRNLPLLLAGKHYMPLSDKTATNKRMNEIEDIIEPKDSLNFKIKN
jgi:hypothetical protein